MFRWLAQFYLSVRLSQKSGSDQQATMVLVICLGHTASAPEEHERQS